MLKFPETKNNSFPGGFQFFTFRKTESCDIAIFIVPLLQAIARYAQT